ELVARRHRRGRRDLRAAHAERAHDRLVRAVPAGVRRAVSDRRPPAAAEPASDAPRPGEPRRGARRRGGRLAAGADRPAGGVGSRGPHGRPVRAPGGRRAGARGEPVHPGGPDPRGAPAGMRGALSGALERASGPATGSILIRGARLFDPRAGLDRAGDVLVREGEIAEVGEAGQLEVPPEAEVVEAEGLTVLPGFVDPHVHLRTPGREDEEDLESGTRAAAAGCTRGRSPRCSGWPGSPRSPSRPRSRATLPSPASRAAGSTCSTSRRASRWPPSSGPARRASPSPRRSRRTTCASPRTPSARSTRASR